LDITTDDTAADVIVTGSTGDCAVTSAIIVTVSAKQVRTVVSDPQFGPGGAVPTSAWWAVTASSMPEGRSQRDQERERSAGPSDRLTYRDQKAMGGVSGFRGSVSGRLSLGDSGRREELRQQAVKVD
jgi:hypothetical protein